MFPRGRAQRRHGAHSARRFAVDARGGREILCIRRRRATAPAPRMVRAVASREKFSEGRGRRATMFLFSPGISAIDVGIFFPAF